MKMPFLLAPYEDVKMCVSHYEPLAPPAALFIRPQ